LETGSTGFVQTEQMQNILIGFQSTLLSPLSLITNKGLEGPGQLLMVLLLHHLETVAQTDSEAQRVVVAEMEDSETTFPHMGLPSQRDCHSSIHQQRLNFLVH
jgi:hypothetical protein